MANILVKIYAPQEVNHSSYIHTGLFEMQALGLIDVKIYLKLKTYLGTIRIEGSRVYKEHKRPQPKTSYYKIIDKKKQKTLTIAIDLYDAANQFSAYALSHCDVVFKRNYETKYMNQLPKSQAQKIKRFGLSFPLNSKNYTHKNRMFFGLIINTMHLNLKFDKNMFSRIKKSINVNLNEWRYIQKSRALSNFQHYAKSRSNTVLFQTRCFPHQNDTDVKEIHEQRYTIIKCLKNNFRDNFNGGFVPSKIANELYNDALTNLPTEQKLYIKAVKNAGIVIYTRGLSNSPAWKLPEYLSQGKVIIAENLTAELPVPLEHGKDVLFFNNLEELVSNVNLVLNNMKLREELSKNARKYYENYINPVERMKYVINNSFDYQIIK